MHLFDISDTVMAYILLNNTKPTDCVPCLRADCYTQSHSVCGDLTKSCMAISITDNMSLTDSVVKHQTVSIDIKKTPTSAFAANPKEPGARLSPVRIQSDKPSGSVDNTTFGSGLVNRPLNTNTCSTNLDTTSSAFAANPKEPGARRVKRVSFQLPLEETPSQLQLEEIPVQPQTANAQTQTANTQAQTTKSQTLTANARRSKPKMGLCKCLMLLYSPRITIECYKSERQINGFISEKQANAFGTALVAGGYDHGVRFLDLTEKNGLYGLIYWISPVQGKIDFSMLWMLPIISGFNIPIHCWSTNDIDLQHKLKQLQSQEKHKSTSLAR